MKNELERIEAEIDELEEFLIMVSNGRAVCSPDEEKKIERRIQSLRSEAEEIKETELSQPHYPNAPEGSIWDY